jgi:hypothetical protein
VPVEPHIDIPFPDAEFLPVTDETIRTVQIVADLWHKNRKLPRTVAAAMKVGLHADDIAGAVSFIRTSELGKNEFFAAIVEAVDRSRKGLKELVEEAERERLERSRREAEEWVRAFREEIGDYTPGPHNIAFCAAEDCWRNETVGYYPEEVVTLSGRPYAKHEYARVLFERDQIPRDDIDRLGNGYFHEVIKNPDADVSGIRWDGNWYLQEKFEACSALVFDVDGGSPTVEDLVSCWRGHVAGVLWTSKSHRKPKCKSDRCDLPCDRYHGLVPLDKTVHTLAKYKEVAAAFRFVLLPDCDPAITNGNFKVRGGPTGCEIHSFRGGRRCIDTEKLLRLAREFSPEFREFCETHVWNDSHRREYVCFQTIGKGKPSAVLANRIAKHYLDTNWKTDDTHRVVWGLCCYAWSRCLDPETVKASLLEVPVVEKFLLGRDDRARDFDTTLVKALNQHLSDVENRLADTTLISPLNEVRTFGADDLPELPEDYKLVIDKYNAHHNIAQFPEMELTHRLFLKAMSEKDGPNVMENVPPGMGKSTAVTCYAAFYVHDENRIVIVKPTVEAALRQRDDLLALAPHLADDVSVLCAMNAELCPFSDKHDPYYRKEVCWTCHLNAACRTDGTPVPVSGRCPIAQTKQSLRQCLAKNIVIVTHRRWVDWLELNSEPEGRTVICDENPATYETFTFTAQNLLDMAGVDAAAKDRLVWLRKHMSGNGSFDGTGDISPETKSKILSRLKKAQDGLGSAGVHDYLPTLEPDAGGEPTRSRVDLWEAQQELLIRYLACFRHTDETNERFVADNCDGSWTFVRCKLANCPRNRTIILDGSAIYSNVEWEGFEIWRVREQSEIGFGNVTIHAVRGNPTKNNMEKNWGAFTERIQAGLREGDPAAGNRVALLCNKGAMEKEELSHVKELRDWLAENGYQVTEMFKGRIIGSNAGNDCGAVIVGTSVFNNITYYLLQTMLRTRQIISEDEVWNVFFEAHEGTDELGQKVKRTEKKRFPRMRDGFIEERLNQTFIRQYCATLYQYILRSRARRYQGDSVDVFAFVPGNWAFEEIRRMMPGINIVGGEADKLDRLRKLTKQQMETINDSDLLELEGYDGKPDGDGKMVKAARERLSFVYAEKLRTSGNS